MVVVVVRRLVGRMIELMRLLVEVNVVVMLVIVVVRMTWRYCEIGDC